MNSFDFNENNINQKSNRQYSADRIKSGMPSDNIARNEISLTGRVKNPYYEKVQGQRNYRLKQSPVISGYFVKEKSYKEIIISRINTALCGILGCLVLVCLVSYYFVVSNEIELRKISKETIALNYDNAEMQNKLDNLQSFSNVDFEVTKSNILTRAKQVIELSAANIPNVSYDKTKPGTLTNRYLGY